MGSYWKKCVSCVYTDLDDKSYCTKLKIYQAAWELIHVYVDYHPDYRYCMVKKSRKELG